MQVKKIRPADYHNANGLNGQKPRAKYGIFQDGVLVGVVLGHSLWEAWSLDCKRPLLGYACGTLKQLKEALAKL